MMAPKDLETWIAIIIAISGALFGLYMKGIVPMFKLCKNKYDSIKSFVCDLQESVQLVKTELQSNHGSSIKDAIFRIDDKVHILEAKNRAYFAHVHLPIIEFDINGHLVWMNRSSYTLFGKDLSELRNFGWLSSIDPEDRERVEEDITNSVRQQRSFSTKFKIINQDKSVVVVCDAAPIITNNGKFNGYFGTLQPANYKDIVCPLLQ